MTDNARFLTHISRLLR